MSSKKKKTLSESSEDADDPEPVNFDEEAYYNASSPEQFPEINHYGTKSDYNSSTGNTFYSSPTKKRKRVEAREYSIDSDSSYQQEIKVRRQTSSFSENNDSEHFEAVDDMAPVQSDDDSVNLRKSQDNKIVINHYGAQKKNNYYRNDDTIRKEYNPHRRRETSSFSEDNAGEFGENGDISYTSDKSPEPGPSYFSESVIERNSSYEENEDNSEVEQPYFEQPTYKVPNSVTVKSKRVSQLSNSTSSDTDPDDNDPSILAANSKTMRMMKKMGYSKGTGLGKHSQGIKEPIAESTQVGKRGFGFEIPDLKQHDLKYDPSMEVIQSKEQPKWFPDPSESPPTESLGEPPSYESIIGWLVLGDRKETIDDEMHFCKPTVLTNILNSKSVFDKLDGKELMKTRSRANPFESIKGVFFLNRAAMKMANIDAVFDFMFTEPKDKYGRNILNSHDLLYFADVCAGPGGFTEYVLYRKKWRAKGIGFTLRGANDFRLEDFYAAAPETFEPYYGVKDDGDVYSLENIESLYKHVMKVTKIGVHFMMADGGFSVSGQENIQEILSKRLYLCQCLVALRIVRKDGHFVVKLFDIFTSFSVGLIYLMHLCFEKICIHKPNTSRPANSERYLICKFKKSNCQGVIQYMTEINKNLEKLTGSDTDVTDIVPLELLKDNDKFYDYVYESNNSIGDNQIVQLLKIAHYADLPNYRDESQVDLRAECLKLYQIPDKTRHRPESGDVAKMVRELLKKSSAGAINPLKLNPHNVEKKLKGHGYRVCMLATKEDDEPYQLTLFAGLGGRKVYRYKGRDSWERVAEKVSVSLPYQTIVLGEIVQEFTGEGPRQTNNYYLHIVDGAVLAGEDIRQYDLDKRQRLCKSFTEAIQRSGNMVRSKHFFKMQHCHEFIKQLTLKYTKNGHAVRGYPCEPGNDSLNTFIRPGGLLLLPKVKEPYTMEWGRTHRAEYYFNMIEMKSYSLPECPKNVVADFQYILDNHFVWWWNGSVKMHCDLTIREDPKELQPYQFTQIIKNLKINHEHY